MIDRRYPLSETAEAIRQVIHRVRPGAGLMLYNTPATNDQVDAMTADWTRLPHDFLAHLSNRLINEAKGVNRVVLDISSKPPATIEWE